MEQPDQKTHDQSHRDFDRRTSLVSQSDIFELHSEMLAVVADLAQAQLQLDSEHPAEFEEVNVALALNLARTARQHCRDLMKQIRSIQPKTEDEILVKHQALCLYHAVFDVDNMIYQLPLGCAPPDDRRVHDVRPVPRNLRKAFKV